MQVITATRDCTGGSLGYTPDRTKGSHLLALQFYEGDLVSEPYSPAAACGIFSLF